MNSLRFQLSDPFLVALAGGEINLPDQYAGPDPNTINEIVPVVFYGRSGSVFLCSLLDDHPELISMGYYEFREFFKRPELIGFDRVETQLANFLRIYGLGLHSPDTGENQFLNISGQSIHVPAQIPFQSRDASKHQTASETGHSPGFSGPRIDLFIGYFIYLVERYVGDFNTSALSLGGFFLITQLAYNAAIGRKLSTNAAKVIWGMHVPDKVAIDNLGQIFDKVTLIHTVRRPSQTLGSHFRRYLLPGNADVNGGVNDFDCLSHVFASLISSDEQVLAPPHAEFAVRLEDIHSYPEATMRTLAKALGIAFEPCLLESTMFGQAYTWNQSAGRGAVSGFSTAHLENQYPDLIPPGDMAFIENLLADTYQAWDYQPLSQIHADAERAALLENRLAIPFAMELLAWEKASVAAENKSRNCANVLASYQHLRNLLLDRMRRKPTVFPLLAISPEATQPMVSADQNAKVAVPA